MTASRSASPVRPSATRLVASSIPTWAPRRCAGCAGSSPGHPPAAAGPARAPRPRPPGPPRPHRRRPAAARSRPAARSPEAPPAPRRPPQLTTRDVGADQQLERGSAVQLALVGQLPQHPLAKLHRPTRLAPVQRQAGAAQLRRRRSARLVQQPQHLRRPALSPSQLGQRHQRPSAHAGREREKSSIEASSSVSASAHRPRHSWTAPYSARQKASM